MSKFSGYNKQNHQKTFTNYTAKEGLSGNSAISCIIKDKSGALWFVNDGVTKFDGKTFTHFTEKDGLGSNDVTCILKDNNGDFWFGTAGAGISKLESKTFRDFTEKNGLCSNNIQIVFQDKTRNFWFASAGTGISKFDGNTFTTFLSDEHVACIMQDKEGDIWFGTTNGIFRLNGKGFTNFTEKEGLCGKAGEVDHPWPI